MKLQLDETRRRRRRVEATPLAAAAIVVAAVVVVVVVVVRPEFGCRWFAVSLGCCTTMMLAAYDELRVYDDAAAAAV